MSPLLAGLGLSAVACLSYETSECPSGHLCPAGTQCVDVPGTEVSRYGGGRGFTPGLDAW